MGTRLRTIVVLVFAGVIYPHEARAGVMNLIWGMSGPMMIGPTVVECKIDLTKEDARDCRLFDFVKFGSSKKTLAPFTERKLWFSGEFIAFFSTNKTSNRNDYSWGDTQMYAFEPVLEWRPGSLTGFHVGGGGTFDIVHRHGQDSFWNAGLKMPVGVWFSVHGTIWDGAFVLRLYPHRFTAENFGNPVQGGDTTTGWEPTVGISVTHAW